VRAVTAYIASLPPPPSRVGPQHRDGEQLFSAIGCVACHTPTLSADGIDVALYSDLLLHDLPLDGCRQFVQVNMGMALGRDERASPVVILG